MAVVEVPRDAAHRSSYRAPDLSTARIRDLSAARRATIRIRSWCVVGTLVCAVAVIELAWLIVQHVRTDGWFWKPILYTALIPVAAFWTIAWILATALLGLVFIKFRARL